MRYLHHQHQPPITLTLALALPLLLLTQHVLPTLADTEIINFAAGDPVLVVEPLPSNWTVLHPGANEIIVRDRTPAPRRGGPRDSLCHEDDGEDVHSFGRHDCPHELWLVLDLDGDLVGDRDDLDGKREDNKAWNWKGHYYDRFTLRVSWPASHPVPVEIELSLHRPRSASPSTPSVRMSRLHFARIRITQEGVRVPSQVEEERGTQNEKDEDEGVPLIVFLEPLVLGVLPASVLPVAVALLLLSILGIVGATTKAGEACVSGAFGGLVERARRELAVLEENEDRKER